MKNKLNYAELVTILFVIIIAILIGLSVYNNKEVFVLNPVNDAEIKSSSPKETDKNQKKNNSESVDNNTEESQSANLKKNKNSDEAIKKDKNLPFPEFDLFSIDSSGLATIAGKGLAGHHLEILLDGKVIAILTPDENGEFATILDLGISNTPRSLTLRIRHADGRVVESAETVLITPIIDSDDNKEIIIAEENGLVTDTKQSNLGQTNEDKQEKIESADSVNENDVDGVKLDKAEVSVAIVSSKELKVLSPAFQKDAPKVSDVIIDAISYDEEGEVLLSGRGVVDQHIRIYVDNKPIKTRSIEADGTWKLDLQEIEAGVYILRIDQLNSDGLVTSRTETPFQKETSALAKQMTTLENGDLTDTEPQVGIGLSTVIIQPGYTLWAVARKTYGFGMQYVRIYHANRDQIRDPDLIYPGQIFKLPE